MKREEIQAESVQSDERVQRALDRLAALVAPAATDDVFVSGVMQRIQCAGSKLCRPKRGPWLVRAAIAAAACLAAMLAVWGAVAAWRTSTARPAPPINIASIKHEEKSAVALPPIKPTSAASAEAAPSEAAPVERTSTWSVVNECVVIENDVPVRKLLYREFERVELLDAHGNTESQLVVPTKAMLVANKEVY